MTQDRTLFGMTTRQVGFVAGLGVIVCLLFGIVGWLAMRGGLGLSSRTPDEIPTALPTSTRLVTPTAGPTGTPTPVPYDQLIPYGWTRHQTQLIELWLPPDFETAATGEVSGVSGNAVFLNLALASSAGKTSYPISLAVSYEPLTTDTLEDFLDVKLSNIPLDVNKAEHRKVSVNSVEAYRLLFEGRTSDNLSTNDLLYIFQDGGTVWYVKYSAEINEFYEMLPVFEESIKTFRIVR
jgi:hypothetical protein